MNSKLFPSLALVICFSVIHLTDGYAQTNANAVLTPQTVIQKCLAAYAALNSYSDDGKTVESRVGQTVTTVWNSHSDMGKTVDAKTRQTNITTFSIRMQRPNLFRIIWTQTSESHTNNGSWWSDSDTNFGADNSYFLNTTNGGNTDHQPVEAWIPLILDTVREVSGDATAIPEIFLKMDVMGNILTDFASGYHGHANVDLHDEKFGNVDCYVLSITSNPINLPDMRTGRTVGCLWVGKSDYLLRKIQSTYDPPQAKTTNSRAEKANYGETVFIQTHENILVNEKYPAAEFEFPKNSPASSSITLSNFAPTPNPPSFSSPPVATDDSDIVIVSANFGMGKKVADVTTKVMELLHDQPDGFMVNTTTLGVDPLPGKKKRLVVRYECQGDSHTLIIPGGKRLSRQRLVNDSQK